MILKSRSIERLFILVKNESNAYLVIINLNKISFLAIDCVIS